MSNPLSVPHEEADRNAHDNDPREGTGGAVSGTVRGTVMGEEREEPREVASDLN